MRGGRPIAIAAALAAAACSASAPDIPARTTHPLRVMSLNQCTDQLVLALLPPTRIASVTWLSHEAGGSLMAMRAASVGTNHGFAEEVLAQRPDLVVAGDLSTPALRGMLVRLGFPMVEVRDATSIDDVRAITRQVAAAVDERARGEALIADMDRKLARLAADRGPRPRVMAWDRTGFSAGRGTLYDAVLTAAGADNVAREVMSPDDGRPDIEGLLKAAPALLVQGAANTRRPSLGDDVVRHRIVRRIWGGGRTVTIPRAYYACGTPMVADAALLLHRQLRAATFAATTPAVAP